MNIVKTGSSYQIFNEGISTYKAFPVGIYVIRFSKLQGFFVESRPNFEIKEKVYGACEAKADKVLKSFGLFERSLGVIMSGDKGTGKSLTARLISLKAIQHGLPVFLCDTYYPGLPDFIMSINQEAVILFDEFDKTFEDTDDCKPQNEMLSLFDGTGSSKKLYIITCNDLRKLNDYLVNRPGRFHYHLQFDYPTADEVRVYLKDKIAEQYYSEIESVVEFAGKVGLNYDCLRAIAFELNTGVSFSDTIGDLNIVHFDTTPYRLVLELSNGYRAECYVSLDLYSESDESERRYFDGLGGANDTRVTFNLSDLQYDVATTRSYIDAEKLDIENPYDKDDEPDDFKKWEETPYTGRLLFISRNRSKLVNYAV